MNLRTALGPGDLGQIIHLHGWHYAQEYGWDARFEAYVAQSLANFCLHFNPRNDRIWIAEQNGTMAGCIGIVGTASPQVAQLRWFLVHPEARGSGLGRRLLRESLDFCAATARRRIILWTVADLRAAAHLYHSFGFVLVEQVHSERWGKPVVEERYELELDDSDR